MNKIKYLHLIIFLFASLQSFEQEYSKAIFDVNKLEFNSRQSEVSCDIVDGKLIYFKNKSTYRRNSVYNDLYMLDINELNNIYGEDSRISLTKRISERTDFHEGPCFIDKKNNKIYITISRLSKKELKRQIYNSGSTINFLKIIEGDYKDGKISNIKDFTYNNENYSVAHATFSNETNRLYFATTDTINGFGNSDLYYCIKNVDGSWGKPVSLGDKINTTDNEVFPSINNGMLFFSSDEGQDDLDLYYIKETEIGIKKPLLLGGDINSDYDDFLLCFEDNNNDVNKGYFTSNRDNIFFKNDDIYSFELIGFDIKQFVSISVNVIRDGLPVKEGEVILMTSDSNIIATNNISNSNEIIFDSLIKVDTRIYSLVYIKDEIIKKINIDNSENLYNHTATIELDSEKLIDTVKKKDLIVNTINSLANKLSDKEKINEGVLNNSNPTKEIKTVQYESKELFDNIYFAYGSHRVTRYSQEKVKKLIKYINENNVKYVLLEAYTDSRGSKEFNEKLAIRRALSCRKILLKNGIPENKILYNGFGENKLTNDCGDDVECPESEHKLNRRIEFSVMF